MRLLEPILHKFNEKIAAKNLAVSSLWLFSFASPTTIIVAIAIITTFELVAPGYYQSFELGSGQLNRDWFPVVVFNPVLESIILGSIIIMSDKYGYGKYSSLLAATLMASFHSLQNPVWGLTVFAFFLIQAHAFQFLNADRRNHAFLVLAISHAMHNAWVLAVRNIWY